MADVNKEPVEDPVAGPAAAAEDPVAGPAAEEEDPEVGPAAADPAAEEEDPEAGQGSPAAGQESPATEEEDPEAGQGGGYQSGGSDIDSISMLGGDPLFLVLSEFFMTKSGKNIADVLEEISEKLDTKGKKKGKKV